MGNNESSIDVNANIMSSIPETKSTNVTTRYTVKEPNQTSQNSQQISSTQMQHLQVITHMPQPSESFTGRLSSRTPSSFANITPTQSNTSFPSTPIPLYKRKHTRNSSFSHVCNGITGTHICSRISKIAAKFWRQNIDTLQMDKQLEVACSILFGALSANKEMKEIINFGDQKIEKMSLRYLDMFGWLIRYLLIDDIDLYSMLTKLGIVHQKTGVKIVHFGPFLESMHETFYYYFPKTYTIEVKYALDEIFTLSAQIMTGEDLKYCQQLNDITKSFENENNIEFLGDLNICLKSKIGKQYLYRFFQQTFCDEIVIFLQLLSKFKSQLKGVQKFMVARDIIKSSINENANFTLNISFECRINTLDKMQELEKKFITKQSLNVGSNFFEEVEQEIYKLIMQNHWNRFVNDIQLLHDQSFGKL